MTDLDAPCPLAPEQIARFRRDGFIKLKQVLGPETLAHFGREITRLTLELNTEQRPLHERGTYDRAFLQVMNLWEQSPLVARFVMGRRLAHIAAQLLEVDGVRLYHDQSLYKEPGGGLTPAHADQFYWPLASDRTVTAWIPLQPVPDEMGPLGFWPGSQREAVGRELSIGDESEAVIGEHLARRGYAFEVGPFELGEVSFHLGWTFHKAGPNRSDRPRSVMTVIYMDAAMRMARSLSPAQRNDADQWCPGAREGEPIDTRKNPVIWRA
jgi:ectoine hydroxylase-related dioxygenase (phytanoyl-CoA dioxygenase family)